MPAFTPIIAARLRELACRGVFELHLTVDADTDARRAGFVALCASLGVKCVMIELARGEHRAQPMTSSRHAGELAAIVGDVEALHAQLGAAGYRVVRVKLEADATNDGIPIADRAAYFEFHAKLRLAPESDEAELAALCIAAHAHLSRNARERDASGAATRFVTMRVFDAARDAATARFAALVDVLTSAGFDVAHTKAEYTIYDDRIALDAGWLA